MGEQNIGKGDGKGDVGSKTTYRPLNTSETVAPCQDNQDLIHPGLGTLI